MLRLIAIFSFALIWLVANGVALCPFPGSTNGAFFTDKSISWQNRPSFREGDTVQYECHENWRPVEGVDYSLTCQRNGSWSGPLPICGMYDTLNRSIEGVDSCSPLGTKEINYLFAVNVNFSTDTKEIYEIGISFCTVRDFNLFLISNLDRVKQCSPKQDKSKLLYKCKQLDLQDIDYEVTFLTWKRVPLPKFSLLYNPGYQCGWPPLPVNADDFEELVLGNSTRVSYKCKNNLVLEGPQTSTCDQGTGQWTELPKCICPDPIVPADLIMIQRDDFSARFHCNGHSVSDLNGDQEGTCDPQTGEWTLPMCISPDLSVTKETDIVNSSNLLTEIQLTDGFFLHNETRTSPSDQLTEQVTELPGTNSGPTVPGSDEVVNRSNLSTEISHNEELTLLNESPTSASKQLAEQVTRLTVSIPGLAVPVNGEVVNRSSFAMIAVIAIQFCAFIFFN